MDLEKTVSSSEILETSDVETPVSGVRTIFATSEGMKVKDSEGNTYFLSEVSLPLEDFVAHDSSTGLVTGGALTPNIDPSKFDISDGYGYIIDIFTDVDNPTITKVSWSGKTAVVSDYVNSLNLSYIAIDSNGDVIQSAAKWDTGDARDLILLGALLHTGGGGVITNTTDEAKSLNDYIGYDLAFVLGDINISGNQFSAASTDLTLQLSAGTSFRAGARC